MEEKSREDLIEENKKLKEENEHLKERLEKYVGRSKRYYERNKEEILAKSKEKKLQWNVANKDKIKVYNRNAYLKRKNRLLEESKKEE